MWLFGSSDLVVVRRETIGLGFVIPDRALVVIG